MIAAAKATFWKPENADMSVLLPNTQMKTLRLARHAIPLALFVSVAPSTTAPNV